MEIWGCELICSADIFDSQNIQNVEDKHEAAKLFFKDIIQSCENENSINFVITDLKKEIVVSYQGLLPNLFAEGKGVVAEGKLKDKKYFIAENILAKHDENYMPPEVSKALENSNN